MNKVIHIGLLLLIAAVCLIFWHSTTQVYGLIKIVTLEMGVLWLCGLWLIKIAANTNKNYKEELIVSPGPLGWAVIAFIVSGWVSLFQAANIYEGFQSMLQWSSGALLFFIVVNYCSSPAKIKKIFITLVFVGLCSALYCAYQTQIINFKIYRLAYISTFGNPIFFAQYLSVAIPLALVLIFISGGKRDSRKKYVRFLFPGFCGFSTAVMLILLVLSRSRGALIGLFVGLFCCAAILLVFIFREKKKVIFGVFIGLIVLVLIGASALIPQAKGYLGKNIHVRNLMRVHVWKSTVEMIFDHPVLGSGAGNFKIIYPLYRSSEEKAITPPGVKYSKAHNDFLQIWAEMGSLGFICFGFILFFIFRDSFLILRCFFNNQQQRKAWGLLFLGTEASLIGLLVQGLFNPVLQTPASGMCFWVLVGLLTVVKINIVGKQRALFNFLKINKIVNNKQHAPYLRGGVYLFLVFILLFFPAKIARPLASDYFLERASREFSNQNIQPALNVLNKSIGFYPYNVEAYFLQGRINQQSANHLQAIDAYREALQLDPYSSTIWNNLGTVYFQAGKLTKAEESFRRAVDIDGDFEGGLYNLSIIYERMGKTEDAEAAAERLRVLNSNFLGNIHLKNGFHDKAVWEYYKAVRRDPKNIESLVKLASILYGEGKIKEAEEMYKQAISLRNECVEAHEGLALLFQNDGRINQAIIEYSQVVKAIPQELENVFKRISYLNESGFFQQASNEYQEVEKLNRKKIKILKKLINLHKLTGNNQAALKVYYDLTETSSQDQELLIELAAIYQAEGMYDEARKTYQKLLSVAPENEVIKSQYRNLEIISANHALAEVYLKQGLISKAIEEYKNVLLIFPNDLYTLISLARAYETVGQFTEAEITLKAALNGGISDSRIYLSLGRIYCAMDRKQDAEGVYKKAIETSPYDIQNYLTLGGFYCAEERLDEAETMYRKAIEIDLQNAQAHLSLGVLFKDKGAIGDAKKEFKKAIDIDPDNHQAQILVDALGR